jgi:hypothetical protein
MALINCIECKNEISTTALSCPKCGAKVVQPKKTMSWIWWVLILIVVIFVLAGITGPKNTVELAKRVTDQCIRNQGDGGWRASSGVSLEMYCKTKGNLEGIRTACQIDPSKC